MRFRSADHLSEDRPRRAATPLRALRVIARLNVGGPARHTVLLDAGLRRRGWETLLVHGQTADTEAEMLAFAEGHGVPRMYLPSLGRRIRPWDDLVTMVRLIGLLRRYQPDVVHTHTAKAGTLGRIAAAVHNSITRRGRRAAIVHTFHGHVLEGYFGPWGNRAVRTIERGLARLADRVIVISPSQRRDLVDRFRVIPPDRASMISLGLALDPLLSRPEAPSKIRSEYGWTPEHFVVGYVGRLVPIKDLRTLIEGFGLFASKHPAARLLIVGDGESRPELETAARNLHLAEVTRFSGWRDDLPDVYGAMNAFTLTSRNEGTPVSLIEAMAAGIPAIATAVGGVPDVLRHEETGLLVPPRNAGAICNALAEILSNPDGAANRAARARQSVAEAFRTDRMIDQVDELYRTILARKRAHLGSGSI